MSRDDNVEGLNVMRAELLAGVLRRCLGIDAGDNTRQDFGDLNGSRLQRPSEAAAELLRALSDEGLTIAIATPCSEVPIAVLAIIYDLARESLAKREEFAKNGWAMLDMPHEAEVRAALAATPEPAPLDVERLARAIHADPAQGCPPGDECMRPSRHLAFAGRIAPALAALEADHDLP